MSTAIVAAIRVASLRRWSTEKARFGRRKSPRTITGCASCSERAISVITAGVAVAVSAIIGARTTSRSSRRRRYSGRKSWPHWLTQWASSIATSAIGARASRRLKPSSAARSGET